VSAIAEGGGRELVEGFERLKINFSPPFFLKKEYALNAKKNNQLRIVYD